MSENWENARSSYLIPDHYCISISSEETPSVCCHIACFGYKEMDKSVFRRKRNLCALIW